MAQDDGLNLRAGAIYLLNRSVSAQFSQPILVRHVRVDLPETRRTYDGWAWIDVYQLNTEGQAVEKRSLFVQPARMREYTPAPAPTIPHQTRRTTGRPQPARSTA